MGYSARYHAVSIAAVFVALAIGILIGAEFGGDVVSGTSESLERSLQGDLEDARGEVDALDAELERERDFGRRAYPGLVGGRLAGAQVGLVALGELPQALGADVRAALEPAGAELAAVAVVREPPDTGEIAEAAGSRGREIADDDEALEEYAQEIGAQVVRGGVLLERTRGQLFSQLSGELGNLDALVIARSRPEDLDPMEAETVNRLESGLMAGAEDSGAAVVGVERTDSDPSSIGAFSSQDMATVDSVDLTAGRVALIFALLGAEGDFGIKASADQLLPDVLGGPLGPVTPR